MQKSSGSGGDGKGGEAEGTEMFKPRGCEQIKTGLSLSTIQTTKVSQGFLCFEWPILLAPAPVRKHGPHLLLVASSSVFSFRAITWITSVYPRFTSTETHAVLLQV